MDNVKKDLISVIVPIYNSELYLLRCIDSIINQTYQNLEIILVDDGSTDRSGEICDNYAKKDNRVKVIHKINGGLGSARNAGLEIAKGKFIGFCDSDDAILADMYETLLLHMEDDVDIVACGRYIYKEDSCSLRRKEYCADKLTKYDNSQAVRELLKGLFAYGVNEKIYRAELFKNIRFPYGISEDVLVTYDLFKKSRNVINTGEAKYCNYVRKNSLSNTGNYFLLMRYLYYIGDILKDIKREYPQHIKVAEAKYLRSACWTFQTITHCENRQQYYKMEKRLNLFFRRMVFRIIINNELSIGEKKTMLKCI
ncbi:MAG: glycosyltransferase [Butyrivibrio sp.]|nr:glycosyltransferase [Butyrivibrio sp.]